MTVNAASDNEKLYFRSDGQFSKLYLAFPQPAIIFKARVNNPVIGTDQILYVAYDTITAGAYADIIPGMTLLVGSSEGASNLGIARIRKAASSTKLFIGETSEVKFADNMYLTVIDEYGLWPRHKYVQSGDTHEDFMDFDIEYDDQHELFDPVPIMGPDRVLFYNGTLGGANTISAYPDGSDSYCFDDTIASYVWTATGASATADLNTATPTFTYDTPGTYRVTLTVTSTDGEKAFTGRRTIVVYDDTALPVSNFKLNSCSGDYESGGWNFKVTMYDDADLTLVKDRAKCILFARDWYGDIATITSTAISFELATKKIKKASGLSIFAKGDTIQVSGSTSNNGEFTVVTSNDAYLVVDKDLVEEASGDTVIINVLHGQTEVNIGQISGCENIICSGWIDKEDISMDINGGNVSFTVKGPQYWLGKMQGFISGLFHSETAPTEWNYVLDLTVDKGLWDILHWRSTATICMDCFLTNDVKLIPTMESSSVGSLWEQLRGQAYDTLLAITCCDRYGRLFIEVDGQLVPVDDRAYTNVMTVEAYDRTGEITVERVTVTPTGLVDVSGVWFDGSVGGTLRALTNGHIVNRYGNEETCERLIFEDQDHCNELAILIYAKKNNPYPRMNINIAANMRLVDICPQQQITIVTDSDYNPRKIEVSGQAFPRRVSFMFNETSKSFSVEIESEPEVTDEYNVAVGEIPVTNQPPSDTWTTPVGLLPGLPSMPMIPPMPPEPVVEVPLAGDCPDNSDVTGPYHLSWDKANIWGDTVDAANRSAKTWLPCTIRSATADHPTLFYFNIRSEGNSYAYLHLYGIDGSGARVATGIVQVVTLHEPTNTAMMLATFNLPAAVSVAGFELNIDSGDCSAGISATFDNIWCQNRHGADWLVPGLSTITLLQDAAYRGYMRVYFSGSCPATPFVLGDIFQWSLGWDSAVAAVGETWIRVNWTASPDTGTMKDVAANVIEKNIITKYYAGPEVSDIQLNYQTDDEVSQTITGSFEAWYWGVTVIKKSIGLGDVSVWDVCPG